jgi:hypothetical protein
MLPSTHSRTKIPDTPKTRTKRYADKEEKRASAEEEGNIGV